MTTATEAATPNMAALYAALARAQGEARAAEKGSTNTYHGYKYASAEAIFAETRDPLSRNGLSLIPLEHPFEAVDANATPEPTAPTGPEERRGAPLRSAVAGWLTRRVLLVHAEGGTLLLTGCWPVIPEKGRPLDKQLAAVLTTSLAYLLRDLLLLPRVSEEIDRAVSHRPEGERDRPDGAPERCAVEGPTGRCKLPAGHDGQHRAPKPARAPASSPPSTVAGAAGAPAGHVPAGADSGKPSSPPAGLSASAPAGSPPISNAPSPTVEPLPAAAPPVAATTAGQGPADPKVEAKAAELAGAVGLKPGDGYVLAPPAREPDGSLALPPGVKTPPVGDRSLAGDEVKEAWDTVLEMLLGDEAAAKAVWTSAGVPTLKKGCLLSQADRALHAAQAKRDELDKAAAVKAQEAAEQPAPASAPAGMDW